jgi:crotonobetainyl-CoA:carnitine CoA-transferase CaiB-like acyl-CoA transferase
MNRLLEGIIVPRADVVIQNLPPSVASKLGVDYVSAVNPQVIFVSSTAFEETGPYQKPRPATPSRRSSRSSAPAS